MTNISTPRDRHSEDADRPDDGQTGEQMDADNAVEADTLAALDPEAPPA